MLFVFIRIYFEFSIQELIIIPGYNHIDYFVADDCAEMVSQPVIEFYLAFLHSWIKKMFSKSEIW